MEILAVLVVLALVVALVYGRPRGAHPLPGLLATALWIVIAVVIVLGVLAVARAG